MVRWDCGQAGTAVHGRTAAPDGPGGPAHRRAVFAAGGAAYRGVAAAGVVAAERIEAVRMQVHGAETAVVPVASGSEFAGAIRVNPAWAASAASGLA
jgi:hypothetical protein